MKSQDFFLSKKKKKKKYIYIYIYIYVNKKNENENFRMSSAKSFAWHFNPSLAEHDMPCLSKQCRSRSVGF